MDEDAIATSAASTLYDHCCEVWRDQSAGTLEIRLDQNPVHHCRSAENRPLSASGQIPAPYWTTTVSSVPTLRRRWREGAASFTLLPVTLAGTIIHLPTTWTQLILDACGPLWSRSPGPWHAPPPPGMRDREKEDIANSVLLHDSFSIDDRDQ